MAVIAAKLSTKYGSFYSVDLFHDLWVIIAIGSAIATVIAVISIAPKDRTEFFGTGKSERIRAKDYWDILKNNRAIQMLVVAASTDKLAGNAAQQLFRLLCSELLPAILQSAELSWDISQFLL